MTNQSDPLSEVPTQETSMKRSGRARSKSEVVRDTVDEKTAVKAARNIQEMTER
jgi:hypothetical protein